LTTVCTAANAAILQKKEKARIDMGMFDHLKCDAPLPDDRLAVGCRCQTKSLFNSMVDFTITAQGRLVYHRHTYEEDGETKLLGRLVIPRYKRIATEDIDMLYHGDVLFYGSKDQKTWVDYVARFMEGQLQWIRPLEALPETHRWWLGLQE